MTGLVYSNGFLKSLQKLPADIQRKAAELLATLQTNPFHPLLHTKKLTGRLAGFLSFRITRPLPVSRQARNHPPQAWGGKEVWTIARGRKRGGGVFRLFDFGFLF